VGALGVVETTGYAGAVSADDGMIKAADVRLVRLTIGSGGRVGALATGSLDAVTVAVKAGVESAARVGEVNGSRVISRPDAAVMACFGHADSLVEVADATWRDSHLAMGIIETRSTVGLVTAIDAMLKSADVVHEGRYRVGYFLSAGVIRGDVGAVKTALESGAAEARKHGELVAAHLIGQPFEEMEETLPHRRLE
jgi:ethanolamine utilization protein EutM